MSSVDIYIIWHVINQWQPINAQLRQYRGIGERIMGKLSVMEIQRIKPNIDGH